MAADEVTRFCEATWRHDQATLEKLAPRIDPHAFDRWGRTPLRMAVQYGDLALVKQLRRAGGDVDQGRKYLTPLTLAAQRKAQDMVDFLRGEGAAISIVTAIHLGDRTRVAQELKRDPALARLCDEEKTPVLHHAVEALEPQVVRMLLDHGATCADTDGNGETALHRIGDSLAPAAPGAAMATLLIDRGADPNARNWDDVTPLHQAVRRRNLAVVEVLLARGADPNARDKIRGSTPLRRAVSATGAGGTRGATALMVPLTRLLLEHGADPEALDRRGVPVHASARNPEVVAVLAAYRGGAAGSRGDIRQAKGAKARPSPAPKRKPKPKLKPKPPARKRRP
jgi:ankyrin repeat protein